MPSRREGGSSAAQAGTTATSPTATAGTASSTDAADASVQDPAANAAGAQAQAGSGGAPATQGPAPVISLMVEADRTNMYDAATNWLCFPGEKYDLCTKDLDATIVRADGTTELEPQEELDVVSAQAARYTRHCRMFAPLYRQVTLGALNGGGITDEARNIGYFDVMLTVSASAPLTSCALLPWLGRGSKSRAHERQVRAPWCALP
jgi:hypothetical protein